MILLPSYIILKLYFMLYVYSIHKMYVIDHEYTFSLNIYNIEDDLKSRNKT